jgi:uncharacterized protein YukE
VQIGLPQNGNALLHCTGHVGGEAVYTELHIALSELENHLRTAEAVVKQVAERMKPLGAEVSQTDRMMIRLGFVKQAA